MWLTILLNLTVQELVGRERARSSFVTQLQLLPPQTHRQCASGERAEVTWILNRLSALFWQPLLHRSRTHKDDLAPDTFVKVSLSRATKVIKVESFHGTTLKNGLEKWPWKMASKMALKTDLRWRRAVWWEAAPVPSTASPSTSSCRRSCWTPPPSTSQFLRWNLCWTSFFLDIRKFKKFHFSAQIWWQRTRCWAPVSWEASC